jgi:hypothetical protein
MQNRFMSRALRIWNRTHLNHPWMLEVTLTPFLARSVSQEVQRLRAKNPFLMTHASIHRRTLHIYIHDMVDLLRAVHQLNANLLETLRLKKHLLMALQQAEKKERSELGRLQLQTAFKRVSTYPASLLNAEHI